jgi:septal ring factor EnvC (AmiA/AmiB activator)
MTMEVKNLTLDTVRNAVIDNELDVNATNASALRKIIGSGSFQTIQKHLETLRFEQKKPTLEQESAHDVEMPEQIKSELDSALTSAFSYIHASVKASVNDKIITLMTLKDEQESRIAQLNADLASVNGELDSVNSELDSVKDELDKCNQTLSVASTNADAVVKEAQKAQEKAEDALAKAQADHALAVEKLLHEHDLKIATLQAELDRVTNLRVEERTQFVQLLADVKPKPAAKRTKQQEQQEQQE